MHVLYINVESLLEQLQFENVVEPLYNEIV